MNYINPIDGVVFEARRLQIQQSIMNLEKRLLKRKQLDLQIEKQALERQSLQKGKKNEQAYQTKDKKNDLQMQLDERVRYLQNLDPREGLMRALQQQKSDIDYLARLRSLQIQQNMIDLQNAHMKEKQFYYKNSLSYGNNLHPLDLSGQMLAKKYSDGTRAIELNEQLKKSTDNLRRLTDRNPVPNKKDLIFQQRKNKLPPSHQKQPDHSTVKKYLLSEQKSHKNNQSDTKNYTINSNNANANAYNPTPIKIIQSSSSTAGFNYWGGNQGKEKSQKGQNLSKVDEQEALQEESSILKSKGLKRSKSKSTQPISQNIVVFEHQHQKSFQTIRPISSKKHSRCLSNRQRSSSTLHYTSGLKPPQPQYYDSLEQKIRKQIQDRLTISQQSKQVLDIFYAKDITQYLQTIYGKQDKFRKQLKEKVCKIPIVERKFGIGLE